MQHGSDSQIPNASKGVERGYGSAPLTEDFSGVAQCPAKNQKKQCSATLTFQTKSLSDLRESQGEIQECPNPDGLDAHRVIIFTGKRDGQEFPFIQATHMRHN